MLAAILSQAVASQENGLKSTSSNKQHWCAGPTVATVGLSVQVPMAVAAEGVFGSPEWLHSHTSAALMMLGAIAVLVGFMGVSLSNTSAIFQRYSQTSAIQQEATDNQADSDASVYHNDSILPHDNSSSSF